ncbi:unnamed protein product [Paramecium sonneborni]|uniref:Uncharacterized protein n=1 Tax=Paramecium sonneborni TaxID=65129 RepID=A0A8S1RIG9_9CILI|nr:unnamed protein product [Paramecium sonneborni]
MECKYGQFELDGFCYDCPGIINQGMITCLDCLLNPKEWYKNPTCKEYIYSDQDGSTYQKNNNRWNYYHIFNGLNIELCVECGQSSIIDQNNIYQDNNFKLQQFKQFCVNEESSNQCYKCSLTYCKFCKILITGEQTQQWGMYRNCFRINRRKQLYIALLYFFNQIMFTLLYKQLFALF